MLISWDPLLKSVFIGKRITVIHESGITVWLLQEMAPRFLFIIQKCAYIVTGLFTYDSFCPEIILQNGCPSRMCCV